MKQGTVQTTGMLVDLVLMPTLPARSVLCSPLRSIGSFHLGRVADLAGFLVVGNL